MGSAHPMSHGNRAKNRHKAVFGNAGRFSRPAGGKMYGKKTSKKVDLRFECTICHKINVIGRSFRARRTEFV